MGRELECKYRLTGEAFASLCEEFAPLCETRMETTYFDTPDRALSAARMTLRQRLENGRLVVTLKTPLPDGSRGEWETEAEDFAQGLALLKDQGAPLPRVGSLQSVCSARFIRRSRLLDFPGGRAELALDQGTLSGIRETLPLLEAELELKEGDEGSFTAFAEVFAQTHDLQPEPLSKFARATRLG